MVYHRLLMFNYYMRMKFLTKFYLCFILMYSAIFAILILSFFLYENEIYKNYIEPVCYIILTGSVFWFSTPKAIRKTKGGLFTYIAISLLLLSVAIPQFIILISNFVEVIENFHEKYDSIKILLSKVTMFILILAFACNRFALHILDKEKERYLDRDNYSTDEKAPPK